jgi:MFS family permease
MSVAMFQGLWGKAYKFFPQKGVFLSCIFIFGKHLFGITSIETVCANSTQQYSEIGSLINALSPNSVALIAGRAVQGLGGAGIGSGCYVISAYIVQPTRLPMVTGLFGIIYACAATLGPVLGGLFTQELTWRWCFWVNLPIGGATFLYILLFFSTPSHSRVAKAPPYRQWPREFDALGVILGLGAWICVLLVLQNGGTEHAWNSSYSIGLLVGFWLLVIAFVVAEWKQGDTAMIPVRLLKSRTICACAICLFL